MAVSSSSAVPSRPSVIAPPLPMGPPMVLRMAQFRNSFGEYEGYEFFGNGDSEVPADGIVLRSNGRYTPKIVSGVQVGWLRLLP